MVPNPTGAVLCLSVGADPVSQFWSSFGAIEDDLDALVFLISQFRKLPQLSETRRVVGRALAEAAASLDR